MTDKMQFFKGNPYPLGATVLDNHTINFAVVLNQTKKCGILLYHKKTKKVDTIHFSRANAVGNIYCMKIEGICSGEYEYNFFEDEKVITDPYARVVVGNEKWGILPGILRGGFMEEPFDWKEDTQLMHAYADSIIYLLHVRGFTKHSSSGVKEKGTFKALTEKIPYLKELGITAVELMPCYEFLEMEERREEEIPGIYDLPADSPKLNYWGYKDAFYFAPKRSYCGNISHTEYYNVFKEMVYQLHQNDIEVILQFYFPNQIKQAYILEVLKYWVYEYHIDGIHLMGDKIPTALLCTEPMLGNIKLFYYDFSLQDIYLPGEVPNYRNLAVCKDDFMYDIRKFVKSDEGMLPKVLYHMKHIPGKTGLIHYVSHSNGFTLADLVSYDRKHNELNGENNMDGNPYNCSWNCGFEGKTVKKTILNLRHKQMKNMEILNILSQGTPLILSGDEFMNSQEGNNNPYCIDNSVTWLNWNQLSKAEEMLTFMKELLAFRKAHPAFHGKKEATMTDYLSYGCPDVSYHGDEPWKLEYDNLTRHFGILYCGSYAKKEDGSFDCDIYLAINMHWAPHEFALPQLPGKKKWYLAVDTQEKNSFIKEKKQIENQKKIRVWERSIEILIGE